MRQVRQAALSRQAAPLIVMLKRAELRAIRALPAYARWLYVELVALSDFGTGQGRTSWAVLGALLDFDRAPTGREPAGAVSLRMARSALDELQAIGLVKRDTARNEAQGYLFFRVQPRARASSSKGESGRGSGRVDNPKKSRADKDLGTSNPQVPAGVPAGGSEGICHTPISPSPGRSAALAVLAAAGRGGKKRAPKGA